MKSTSKWRGKVTQYRNRFDASDVSDIDVGPVIRLVASRMEVSVLEIRSRDRTQQVARARAVLMCLLRRRGYSLPAIGTALQRNHTCVLYACRRAENDVELRTIADELEEKK